MKLIKTIDRTDSGSPVVPKHAYLLNVDDVALWYKPEPRKIVLPKFPDMKQYSFLYRLYITQNSQKYNFDTVGNHDERAYKQKLTGTHPGRSVSLLEFAKNQLDSGFIIFIPDCDGQTLVLGSLINPLYMTTAHESSISGRKFTFNFEQEMPDEDPYLIGNFNFNEDVINTSITDDFIWLLSTEASSPIIFDNNKLIKIHPNG